MTSEVIVMNSLAVALAADSAATVSDGRDNKVYNSANKLFMLSKHHPVGVMVYNNSSLLGIPWETILKMFREDLGPKEFALLEFLMRHEGQPVSRTTIVEQVWKLNFDTMTNVVDVYINYLRRKVDSGYDRALIRTIRGVGYQIGGNGQHA